jgi:hypothetical protein
MKFKIILFLGIIVGLAYCKKDNSINYKSTGKILGPDYRMCICCGGYTIAIDSLFYNFESLPSNSNINLQKEAFPINVKIDWQVIASGCPNWITIQRIVKE